MRGSIKMQINKASNISGNILSITSYIVSALCIILHFSSEIKVTIPYFIIPIFYSIMNTYIRRYEKYSLNISVIIIEALMIIRYLITPLSYYISNEMPYAFSYVYTIPSIILMVYEMCCVFLALNYFCPKILNANNKSQKRGKRSIKLTDVGTSCMILVFLLTLLRYPQYLRNLFTFQFDLFESVEISSNIDGMYNLIYKAGIITINCLLLSKLSKSSKTLNYVICILFCWFSIWTASVGTSGSISRTSFLSNGIIFVWILQKRFPRQRKISIISSIVVIVLLLSFGTISRFYSDDSSNFFSRILSFEMLDSYFGGLRDISVGMQMKAKYHNSINIITFLTDVIAGMPFLGSRIGLNFNNRIPYYFNMTLWGRYINISRICPMIAQGYAYFGFVLAPLITVFFIWCSLKCNKALYDTDNELEMYMYCLLIYYFSASFVMYNINIIMGGLWNKVFPIFIVFFLNRFRWMKQTNKTYMKMTALKAR